MILLLSIFNYWQLKSPITPHGFGVGRGVTGRLFSLLAGREFALGKLLRFTLLRGVALTLSTPPFAFGRFTFGRLFELLFAFLLPLAFSLAFLFLGFLGLLSLVFADALALRLSPGSSGVTFSGVSPSLAARLMSIATV